MRIIATLVALAISMMTFAQDWAKAKLDKSPRHQEWVQIKHGDRSVHSFVVYPEVSGKAPVVIVIHEIMGMTDWIQSVADELAAAGYIAIAPDLLSGMGPGNGRTTAFEDLGKVREAISNLPPDQITADLNAVADYGKGLPASNGKLSVSGFCWGGTQSWNFATNRKDLSSAIVFYGTAPTGRDQLARINAPVYGFYGGNDARVNTTVPDTLKMMAELNKKFEATTYPGAGHGFLRAGEMPDASADNKAAMEKAWLKWKEILKSTF